MFNGQITYGDVLSVALVLGLIITVLLGGVVLATQLLNRKK